MSDEELKKMVRDSIDAATVELERLEEADAENASLRERVNVLELSIQQLDEHIAAVEKERDALRAVAQQLLDAYTLKGGEVSESVRALITKGAR